MTFHEYSEKDPVIITDFWAGCFPGLIHETRGMACQDAQNTEFGVIQGIPYAIASVADGHGQSQHDLSEYGAKIAVQCATDILRMIVHKYSTSDRRTLVQSGKYDYPRLVTRLWRERILVDAAEKNQDISDSKPLTTRYGTTLLSVLCIHNLLLCTQIGDGDIILVTDDLQISRIFSIPSHHIGTDTHSLSSPSAQHECRTAAISLGKSQYLFLSSDGLSDSFNASDETRYDEWIKRVVLSIEKHGFDTVISRLPGWLREISSRGAGDDISLIIMKFG